MSFSQEKFVTQIDAYFRNELSEEEKFAFESWLKENPDFLGEFEIHKELYAQFDDSYSNISLLDEEVVKEIESYYKSDEVSNLKKVINKAHANYQKKGKRRSINKSLLISLITAASFALLIVFYNPGKNEISNQELYATYSNGWNDLPSLTSRGVQDELSLGQALFEEGKYQLAYVAFKSLKETKKEDRASILIYLGVSALELNQYQKAIFYFDQLIQSDAIDSSKGYWYKALSYLKQGKKRETIAILIVISKNKENFNYDEALELLNELE